MSGRVKRVKSDLVQNSPVLKSANSQEMEAPNESPPKTEKRRVLSVSQSSPLLTWQHHLQGLCAKAGEAVLYVRNDLDLESSPPPDFEYICRRVASPGIHIASDPVVYCKCKRNARRRWKCGTDRQCCPYNNESQFAYTDNSRATQGLADVIFECNNKCLCDRSCPNRVVQNGRQVPLCIFKTRDRGWGVRTVADVKAGTFVTEYVGEVIEIAEARRREDNSYLFDLDLENDSETKYSIDAKKRGNVAHFINHSCDANMIIRGVYIDCQDKDLPHLALFASKDIAAGEEITFDYFPHLNFLDSQEQNHGTKSERAKPCRCGAATCRGILMI